MYIGEYRLKADPEVVFLDEAIALLKVINARTAMLLAEYDHIKKAIAEGNPEERKAA
jgi:hypothetical protein